MDCGEPLAARAQHGETARQEQFEAIPVRHGVGDKHIKTPDKPFLEGRAQVDFESLDLKTGGGGDLSEDPNHQLIDLKHRNVVAQSRQRDAEKIIVTHADNIEGVFSQQQSSSKDCLGQGGTLANTLPESLAVGVGGEHRVVGLTGSVWQSIKVRAHVGLIELSQTVDNHGVRLQWADGSDSFSEPGNFQCRPRIVASS